MAAHATLPALPLSYVLGTPARVAVLRVLTSQTRPLGGRQVARLAGISHQAAYNALSDLEHAGMVQAQPTGPYRGYALNRSQQLVRMGIVPLFRQEADRWRDLRRWLDRAFGKLASAVTIFGSVATGEARPGSDLDVLVLAETPSIREQARREYERRAAVPPLRFGIRVSPVFMTVDQFRRILRARHPLAVAIARDHKLLLGSLPLEEWDGASP